MCFTGFVRSIRPYLCPKHSLFLICLIVLEIVLLQRNVVFFSVAAMTLWDSLAPLRAVDTLERRETWFSSFNQLTETEWVLPSRHHISRCSSKIQEFFKRRLEDEGLAAKKQSGDAVTLTAWSVSHVQHDAFNFFQHMSYGRHRLLENVTLPRKPTLSRDVSAEKLLETMLLPKSCAFSRKMYLLPTGVCNALHPRNFDDEEINVNRFVPAFLVHHELASSKEVLDSQPVLSPLWSLYSRSHSFEEYLEEERLLQKKVVRSALCWAWGHQRAAGIGSPEIDPQYGTPLEEWDGVPVTLFDALDTLWITGFPLFFDEGVNWLRSSQALDVDANVNVFESTIRILGGLLSAQIISQDKDLLNLAYSLGSKLLKAFAPAVAYPSKVPNSSGTAKVPSETKHRRVPHYCSLLFEKGTPAFTGDSLTTQRNATATELLFGRCVNRARNFTYSRLPYSDINLLTGEGAYLAGFSSLAEVGSLQLEFITLADRTGDCRFHDAVNAVTELLETSLNVSNFGIAPTELFPNWAVPHLGSTWSVGCRGDSFYEYLVKEWIITGRADPMLASMIAGAFRSLQKVFIQPMRSFDLDACGSERIPGFWSSSNGPQNGGLSPNERFAFPVTRSLKLGQANSSATNIDHLVTVILGFQPLHRGITACFLPGLLGVWLAHADVRQNHLDLLDTAKSLLSGCAMMYFRTATGLAPEITQYDTRVPRADESVYASEGAQFSLVRPETLESLFVMQRLTKDPKYRHWGWRIALSIFRHAKGPFGFSSIRDVDELPSKLGAWDYKGSPTPPRQHTWIYAETFKYLFLLFSEDWELEDVLSMFNFTAFPSSHSLLQRVLFNTEAHILPALLRGHPCGRAAHLRNLSAVENS